MRRFYVPQVTSRDVEVLLEGDEAHHAIHVLRLTRGDKLIVLNGCGVEFICECIESDKKTLRARILQKRQIPKPASEVTLFQAIPKGKLIEEIIEKAVELGVSRIIPMTTRRTIPNFNLFEIEKRRTRWEQIAISAIKQCGQVYLPEIENLTDFSELINQRRQFEMNLVCALWGERRHPRTYFEEFRKMHHRNPLSIAVWIGPEGDFTDEEIAKLTSAGVRPITLGDLVLRVETAAVFVFSILNYELQWGMVSRNELPCE